MVLFRVRVRLRRDVERGQDFIAPAGLTGRLVELTERQARVMLDEPLPGAEGWDNCIVWSASHGMLEELAGDLEVLPSDIG